MGSNPIPCAIQHIPCVYDTFLEYLTEVRENAEITAKNKQIIINALRKRVTSLWDSSEVEAYIKNCELSNGRKNLYGQAYRDWCNWKGFDYQPKHFRKIEKLPYIPTENEIDQLIGGLGQQLACFMQILKESAFRPSEAQSQTFDDFNLAQKTCTLNKPAKNSRPRQFKFSDKLMAMILPLIYQAGKGERVFPAKMKTLRSHYWRRRKVLAKRLGNPNLEKITFKTLRHWKATMTYHRTKDILYTQKILGHKSLKNTLIYTHLVEFGEEDNYTVKVATSIDEFTAFLEQGFEYVSDYGENKVCRKKEVSTLSRLVHADWASWKSYCLEAPAT